MAVLSPIRVPKSLFFSLVDIISDIESLENIDFRNLLFFLIDKTINLQKAMKFFKHLG